MSAILHRRAETVVETADLIFLPCPPTCTSGGVPLSDSQEQVLCERDYHRSRTCPRRAHPLGLPLSARLDSVLSNTLFPAGCSWCAEFCMRRCKYLEWERERKVLLERWERDRRDRREDG